MSERPAPYFASAPSIALMQCPIAGFQFHDWEACWGRMRMGDPLVLQREPGNRHDPRAIAVQWQGLMLGYVPREANYALSQMMDRGARAEGRVEEDRREVRLWNTVALEIGSDGRGLAARFLEGAGVRALTLDLRRPLGDDGWIACFVPVITDICIRHGVTNLAEPLRRWIGASLQLTFDGRLDFEALRKAVLGFLAPDALARSLANRIIGPSPTAEAFNWVCGRTSAVALSAIEQPAMLPFLRIAQEDKAMKSAADPLGALRERLLAEGLEPATWKKLARWGFGAFEAMGETWWKPIPVARFANLLHHLGVLAPPPPDFVVRALEVALYRDKPNDRLNLERHPPWFMRALLREAERAADDGSEEALRRDLPGCLDWLMDACPEPDANQQRAGWPWILEQARAHREARELALAAPWAVPIVAMAWGSYHMIGIRSAAELAAEAEAMKNCLESYEEACRAGDVVVYSIRERPTGARIACFAAGRDEDGAPWSLIEVAGKMNAAVGDELERIGHAMVAKLNGGRGGDVAPF